MYHKSDKERVCKRLENFPEEVYVPDDRAALMRIKPARLKELVLWIRLESNNVSLRDLAGMEKHELVELLQEEANAPHWIASQLRNHNFHLDALERGFCDDRTIQNVKSFMRQRIGCQCPICLQEYEPLCELIFLPCGHTFHSECVKSWLVTQLDVCAQKGEYPSCPSCRTPINKRIPSTPLRLEGRTNVKRKRES